MPRSALREIDEAGPEVSPTLKKALKVDDRRIRFYAVRLLGKVGPAAKEVASAVRIAETIWRRAI